MGSLREQLDALVHRLRGRPADVADPPPPPEHGTSPGTVPGELEPRRAAEAAQRERESRASSETKFEELRRQQEADAEST